MQPCELPAFDYPLRVEGNLTARSGAIEFDADTVSLVWTGGAAWDAEVDRACRTASDAARRSCGLCSAQQR
jgi:hypothetical protein